MQVGQRRWPAPLDAALISRPVIGRARPSSWGFAVAPVAAVAKAFVGRPSGELKRTGFSGLRRSSGDLRRWRVQLSL